jgi:NADH-quinone oxidoreductase subunit L
MHRDDRYPTFFVYLNLFVFSMLMLVLADNFLLTFVGWEGVGVCSYWLISFWFDRDTAATAGKKAFLTNRVGDWGFLLAMFLIFVTFGSLQYTEVLERAGELSEVTATAIALLLFVGAVGKSAQLPLYFWLPDAMEGPTPVSALIHAATMVTAGVFLMSRVNPILGAAPDALTVIAIVGALTALFAATIAVAQNDIKRVLAYSTVSQLGYMFLAVGSGAYVAAVFHMITHAFFKALLFLGSGSVIHGMHDEQDMRHMGALRKLLPVTAVTFIIGWLTIAGVPPFAGFWSKDDILLNAWERSTVLWAIGLVTALLTAFYMSRQVYMVFYGEAHWKEGGEEHGREPHESPALMLVPLVALAGLSTVGGAINLPFDNLQFLEHFLEPVFEGRLREVDVTWATQVTLAAVAVVAAVVGIVLARAVYLRKRVEAERVEPEVFREGWYYDQTVTAFFGGPARSGSDWLMSFFDTKVIDGAVNGVAAVVRGGAGRLRLLQTGYVRNYALGVAGGAVFLLGWLLTRASF